MKNNDFIIGLSNGEVEELCNRLIGHKYFLGVYPADIKPQLFFNIDRHNRFALIFNLSNHNEMGSHFIAVVRNRSRVMYFDSFGRKCLNKSIKTFLNKLSNTITFNKTKIQHVRSNFCGYFCIYFICSCLLQNRSISQCISKFSVNDTLSNDRRVVDLLVDFIRNQRK
jgi:hypothetical protein